MGVETWQSAAQFPTIIRTSHSGADWGKLKPEVDEVKGSPTWCSEALNKPSRPQGFDIVAMMRERTRFPRQSSRDCRNSSS